MNRSKFSIAAYVLAVFLSGIVVGGFGQRLYMARSVGATGRMPRNPEEFRKAYVDDMRSRLRLDEPQLARLHTILDETRESYKAFKEQHKPEMKAIHDTQVAKINAILNDSQRAEYGRFRAEREKLMQERKN